MIHNIAFWGGLMADQPIDPDRTTQQYDRSIPALIERFEHAYGIFASAVREARDTQRLDDTFVDHFGLPTMIGGTLLHVVIHNVEHRSEVLHILQRLGVPDLPEVDHLFWEHATQGNEPGSRLEVDPSPASGRGGVSSRLPPRTAAG